MRGTGKRNAMGNVVSEGDVNYGVESNAFFYNLHSEDGHLIRVEQPKVIASGSKM